jgi:hypothetical protein
MKPFATELVIALVFLTHISMLKAETPQLNYLRYCQGCHGESGKGSLGNAVPGLKDTLTKFFFAPEGRDYLVQVADIAQSPIDDKELADLLNWLIERFGTKEVVRLDFRPYDADEIRRPRLNRPANAKELRHDLMKKAMYPPTRN